MTFGVEQHGQPRRLLVALMLAVLAVVVGVGVGVDAHASSPAGQVAGTRVAAHELLAGPVVAASGAVLAGQGRATTTARPDVAIGSRVAPNTTRDLCKAPRTGDYDGQLARGWIPDETFAVRPPDFGPDEPVGDSVFFTLNEPRARSIAAGPLYDGRLIAVSIPADFLDSCDGPNDFDDDEDVQVPFNLLPILNTFPRRPA
ncbi:MAG: hypothetical protein ACRD2W_06030 [Acidimicrobiales bacterium]